MFRRILVATAAAGMLVAGLAIAPAASARDSWSVSIGAPGVAISAGSPGYWGSYYRPYPYYRPYWRSAYYAPPPVYYAPRVVYAPRPYVAYRYYGPYGY